MTAPFSSVDKYRHDFLDDPKIYSPGIWNELRIFLAVAKNKSFNAAAMELGVSQPTVSRAVKHLESVLQQTLTLADQRGITLTPKGQEIAAVSSKLDQSLADLTFQLRKANTSLSGLVHVSMTDGLAAYWLAPEIAKLSIGYPSLSVNIKQLVNATDLEKNSSDLMITFSHQENSQTYCDYLGKIHFTTFASHSYLDRHGLPDNENLQDHYFIQSELYANGTGPWQKWNDLARRGKVSHFSNMSIAYAFLARFGSGIAYLANYVTMHEDAVPLDLGAEVSFPFYLVGRKSQLQDPKICLVRQTILDTFRNSPWFGKEFLLRPSGSRTDTTLNSLFNGSTTASPRITS